jgi:hypothetical protein
MEKHHGVSILFLSLVLPDHEKQVEGTENIKKRFQGINSLPARPRQKEESSGRNIRLLYNGS